MIERWLPIAGRSGYEVSDLGRVRSVRKVLVPFLSNSGYEQVNLGRSCRRYVHQLVLETFVGPCPSGHECRHFPDERKTNNALANLSWGTRSLNMSDRNAHGTSNRGGRNGRAKLTDTEMRTIRCDAFGNVHALAAFYQVSVATIRRLRRAPLWLPLSTWLLEGVENAA